MANGMRRAWRQSQAEKWFRETWEAHFNNPDYLEWREKVRREEWMKEQMKKHPSLFKTVKK